MAKDKKLVEAITSMDTDFAQWYTDLVKSSFMEVMASTSFFSLAILILLFLFRHTGNFVTIYMGDFFLSDKTKQKAGASIQ